MKPLSFMLIAGEASGDMLAAELVSALRARVIANEDRPTADVQPLRTALSPRFFGAGGPQMKAAGVELAFDLTQHSVFGADMLSKYFQLRRVFYQLLRLAIERQPDVIIGVDYGYFNLKFGRAIKNRVRNHSGPFVNWNPKIVQFVSPQVWASRPGRANKLARNDDLLLSIFPFEKGWYARRAPRLRVEFVGHPMLDRFARQSRGNRVEMGRAECVVLLPGSRTGELRRHLPVMRGALELIRKKHPRLTAIMVLPNEALMQQARAIGAPPDVEIRVGNLDQALARADLAISKTGTASLECAFFGVPAVTFYKTSLMTFEIARRIATVKWASMPNLLAGEEVYPEFLQGAATPENIAEAALDLLDNPERRTAIKSKLARAIGPLGAPGAASRAAEAVLSLLR